MYLGWFDDSKRPISAKIEGGKQAYIDRFGYPPTVVLVSDDEWDQRIEVQNIIALHKSWMRKHNYFFGQSDC